MGEDQHIVALLSATEPYNGLSEAALAELAASACRVHVQAGECLIRTGDAARGLYLVESGALKLALPSMNGNEKVLELLIAGRSFGHAELFAGGVFNYYVEALTETWLLLLPARSIMTLVDRDTEFAYTMLMCLGRQFHSLVRDVRLLSTSSAQQRLLLFLVNRIADVPSGEASVDLLVKKSVLASRLGVTPETLSRSLASLVEDGLVSVRGRCLRVLDVEALRRTCQASLEV